MKPFETNTDNNIDCEQRTLMMHVMINILNLKVMKVKMHHSDNILRN